MAIIRDNVAKNSLRFVLGIFNILSLAKYCFLLKTLKADILIKKLTVS